MQPIQFTAHVGDDGVLRFEVPVGANFDCDVVIRVRRRLSPAEWRTFLEETAGSLSDDPIERAPQPPIEERDDIV